MIYDISYGQNKMDSIFEYPNGNPQFTKNYIRSRGWLAVATVETGRDFYFGNDDLGNYAEENGYKRYLSTDAMSQWLRENCEGRWDRCGMHYIDFEFESDALFFKLFWAP